MSEELTTSLLRIAPRLTDEQAELIVTWARKSPSVRAVLLYGSRLTGNRRDKSVEELKKAPDVDIAISIDGRGTTLRLFEFVRIKSERLLDLNSELGLFVHLEPADKDLADVADWLAQDGYGLLWSDERWSAGMLK